ncbi:hypothetical protein AABB24_029773 [Solanum stoloniferum]|uniref:Uncharacterized protein n=1 Tax=Solanum stoloniferum TaxID=62892 RepID=A0ABD2S168_9SOLN
MSKTIYYDSSHGQIMRPIGYCSTMPFSQPTHNNHMMIGHDSHTKHHDGHYGHDNYGSHGHMPRESTNFSSSATMVHSDGSYGSGMQQSSHASSMVSMGHHDHGHGHGYGGSHAP